MAKEVVKVAFVLKPYEDQLPPIAKPDVYATFPWAENIRANKI